MANYVVEAKEQMIQEMKRYYASNLVEKLPPGALFVAKLSGCMITAYRSGKVLFQGKDAEKEVGRWDGRDSGQAKEENFTTVSAIGSDEVGTGDYFGPVVVVAAYVAKEQINTMKRLEVKDSKQLTDEMITRLAPALMDHLHYAPAILSNPEYNRWQQRGMPQTKIKALLHNKAIGKLMNALPQLPDAIIIDQFIERNLYFRYLEGERDVIREHVYCIPKAETVHIAVAAASIIARYLFLQELDHLSETVGIELPKGAGEQVDKAAARLIQAHGEAILHSCAKLHFANTEKARRIANR
ncbi:ribonuclease HIII [Anoxybacillus voinovskiensis]|uniref:Ribonuclease HIII n=1 Tax=Anoxybacteroides voinovskiense TaxID=230470 RepID=A0A840DIK0_9BACL|nr:ribonuclease HIII [Anoxybacillus voinovskiensis]MBB4073141.1 ribonuclease HIII [Anoxybacillus voinovskiensis]GGJ70604.1 ribonuclease HIII [Anoxybacillus voinovskiensis]